MTDTTNRVAPDLRQIIDDFVARLRNGEQPKVDEYVARYSETSSDIADELREILPTLQLIEAAGSQSGDQSVTPDGTVLKQLGEYRILREIGRGGMGVVYEAEQESLERNVAIKVLPYHSLMDTKQIQRFRREARAAGKLHHSNIVPVFGVGQADGVHFFVMQHIRGQSLDDVLEEIKRIRERLQITKPPADGSRQAAQSGSDRDHRQSAADGLLSGEFSSLGSFRLDAGSHDSRAAGNWSGSSSGRQSGSSSGAVGDLPYFRSVANIGVQVADALSYAHHKEVLHRDIKPSNLLLDGSGTVWLTDFGLAKIEEENLTRTGDFVGTLRYMAPEQFEGDFDARSDIYSLGLTMYELLSLRPAFDESDRARLVKQVTQETPPPLRRIDRNIPRNLETIILKAIDREPLKRYQSASALAEDLRQFLGDRPIEARRTPAIERAWLWCRRNRLSAMLISAVFVLLTASSIGSLLYSRQLQSSLDRAVLAEASSQAARSESTQRLYDAYLSQAQSVRLSGRPGRRIEGLAAIGKASQLSGELSLAESDTVALRSEAVACLAHFDLRLDRDWDVTDYRSRSAHPRWAFDPKVERYACELESGEISIRRIDDNVELLRLEGIHPASDDESRPYLVFSPDGRYLGEFGVFDDSAPYVQLFDTADGRALFRKPRRSCLYGFQEPIGFSKDSATFAYLNSDQQLCQLDIATGKEHRFRLKERPTFISYSPDGSRLAVEEGWKDVVLLNPESGTEIRRFEHPESIRRIAWSADGKRIAVPCDSNRICVWDIENSDQPLFECIGHTGSVRHVVYNSGNLLLSTGWDQTTRIWDAQNGNELMKVDLRGGSRFSADDRWIGSEFAGHAVQRYEIVGGQECRVLSHPISDSTSSIVDLNFSPNGRWLATASSYSGFRIWDLQSDRVVAKFRPYSTCGSIAFIHGGTRLLSSGMQSADVWRFRQHTPDTRPTVERLESVYQTTNQTNIYASLAPDGRLAIGERESGNASIFAPDWKTRLHHHRSHGWMHTTVLSPDGKWLACGSWHAAYWKVWDAESGELVKHEKLRNSAAVQFSPDGNWIVIRRIDQVEFRHAGSWELAFAIDRQSPGYANVAFSPDMTLVAVTDMRHTSLYDFASQRLLAKLRGPRDAQLTTSHPGAAAIRFSPDGNLLAIGTYQGSVELWDLNLVRSQLSALRLDW